ncbi:hypothetical protein [Gordonia westfalica]|uniref:Uncharacterized protein n=1 Tax=Gordonia westfalica TaxID=158898 RepID=A0A1H2DLI0_9ACTN|nr:hypothetical protein [Gordonia westfalica]SDT83770.1 hypothetical protein SAMN04488548_10314 [Gordonia westfalica]
MKIANGRTASTARRRRCAPVDAEETLKGFEEKEVTLRWLKPYVSAAEYKLLMTKIPEGTIQWIKKQLEDPDITVGNLRLRDS